MISFIKSKKAQHEILGFVLIVVVVSVIGMVFLLLSLGRTKAVQHNSIEISNLLESSMHYTTDCAVNYVPQYKDGQDLVRSCYNEQIGNYLNCLDGRNVCDALDTTMKHLIQDTLDVDENSPNKAFRLKIYFHQNNELNPDQEILALSQGLFQNCTSRIGGMHSIDASAMSLEVINIELEVCRG